MALMILHYQAFGSGLAEPLLEFLDQRAHAASLAEEGPVLVVSDDGALHEMLARRRGDAARHGRDLRENPAGVLREALDECLSWVLGAPARAERLAAAQDQGGIASRNASPEEVLALVIPIRVESLENDALAPAWQALGEFAQARRALGRDVRDAHDPVLRRHLRLIPWIWVEKPPEAFPDWLFAPLAPFGRRATPILHAPSAVGGRVRPFADYGAQQLRSTLLALCAMAASGAMNEQRKEEQHWPRSWHTDPRRLMLGHATRAELGMRAHWVRMAMDQVTGAREASERRIPSPEGLEKAIVHIKSQFGDQEDRESNRVARRVREALRGQIASIEAYTTRQVLLDHPAWSESLATASDKTLAPRDLWRNLQDVGPMLHSWPQFTQSQWRFWEPATKAQHVADEVVRSLRHHNPVMRSLAIERALANVQADTAKLVTEFEREMRNLLGMTEGTPAERVAAAILFADGLEDAGAVPPAPPDYRIEDMHWSKEERELLEASRDVPSLGGIWVEAAGYASLMAAGAMLMWWTLVALPAALSMFGIIVWTVRQIRLAHVNKHLEDWTGQRKAWLAQANAEHAEIKARAEAEAHRVRVAVVADVVGRARAVAQLLRQEVLGLNTLLLERARYAAHQGNTLSRVYKGAAVGVWWVSDRDERSHEGLRAIDNLSATGREEPSSLIEHVRIPVSTSAGLESVVQTGWQQATALADLPSPFDLAIYDRAILNWLDNVMEAVRDQDDEARNRVQACLDALADQVRTDQELSKLLVFDEGNWKHLDTVITTAVGEDYVRRVGLAADCLRTRDPNATPLDLSAPPKDAPLAMLTVRVPPEVALAWRYKVYEATAAEAP